jgi:hypothetical protein
MKRGLRLLGVTGVVVACSAGAFVAGRQLKSPADAAADRKAPEASKITAAVERRVLSADVILRGDIAYAEPTPVALSGSVGGSSGSATAVATRVPELGSSLEDGQVVLEVSGRPVFAFSGLAPMYRNLTPGVTGPDVLQLEEALVRAGLDPGAVDDRYDDDTERAVDGLYERAGFASQGPTKEQRDQLTSLRAAVTSSEAGVRAAERALADGNKPPTAAEQLELQLAVEEAQRALDDARKPLSEAKIAEFNQAIADAEFALQQARVAADRDALSEQRDLEAKQASVLTAQTEWFASLTKVGQAQAVGAISPATGEPYTAGEIADLRRDANAKQEIYKSATTAVELAVASLEPNRLSREQSIRGAERAVNDAKNKLVEAQAPKPELELKRLENAVSLARQRLADSRAPKDLSTLRQAVTDAENSQFKAAVELNELEVQVGTTVPAGEILFFKALPVQVNELKIGAGDAVTGQFMTVSGSAVAVNASVSSRDVDLLAAEQAVVIELRDFGITLPGSIGSIANKPGTDGAGEGRYAVKVLPDDPVEAQQFAGASAVITVAVESTGGDAVLAVPLAALSSSADGTTRVEVLDDDGTTRDVIVTVGLSAEGYAQVTPTDGQLAEGNRVVVGVQASGPLSTAAPEPGEGDPPTGDDPSTGEPIDGSVPADVGEPVPIEEFPAGEVPAEDIPIDEIPVEDVPIEEIPADTVVVADIAAGG